MDGGSRIKWVSFQDEHGRQHWTRHLGNPEPVFKTRQGALARERAAAAADLLLLEPDDDMGPRGPENGEPEDFDAPSMAVAGETPCVGRRPVAALHTLA